MRVADVLCAKLSAVGAAKQSAVRTSRLLCLFNMKRACVWCVVKEALMRVGSRSLLPRPEAQHPARRRPRGLLGLYSPLVSISCFTCFTCLQYFDA
jgi:hypothetical protein